MEGLDDEAIAKRLCGLSGHSIQASYVKGGKGMLDKRLAAYNAAAQHGNWLILRDLDRDDACPPALARRLLPEPAPGMRFRVAVRAVEAWLLADRRAIATYLSVSESLIEPDPEELPDPKAAMVSLARRSRSRRVRDDMVPPPGLTSRVGPAYTARLIEFANTRWKPERAANGAESLARCLRCLEALR